MMCDYVCIIILPCSPALGRLQTVRLIYSVGHGKGRYVVFIGIPLLKCP